MDISGYIKGINDASFCSVKEEQTYISFAHFLSIQPRECMKLKEEYSPDGIIIHKILYFWLPTPPQKKQGEDKYISEGREKLKQLVQQGGFDSIILDVRGNIGGVLNVVLDVIHPILYNRLIGEYIYGIDVNKKKIASFRLSNNVHIIDVDNVPISYNMKPLDDVFISKLDGSINISVICNRYTMSTGEIICIIVRRLGGTVYGEQTRGLTNGMTVISNNNIKYVRIPTYTICENNNIYYNGITPDKPLSLALKLLK